MGLDYPHKRCPKRARYPDGLQGKTGDGPWLAPGRLMGQASAS